MCRLERTGHAGESPKRSGNARRTSRSRRRRPVPSAVSSRPSGRTPPGSSRSAAGRRGNRGLWRRRRRSATRSSRPGGRCACGSRAVWGSSGKRSRKALASDCQEAAIGGDAHDRLGDAEGRDLGVGDPAPGVSRLLGQEIVRRAINGGAESVEVGVHRGLSVDGCFSTVDFGLSASNPLLTGIRRGINHLYGGQCRSRAAISRSTRPQRLIHEVTELPPFQTLIDEHAGDVMAVCAARSGAATPTTASRRRSSPPCAPTRSCEDGGNLRGWLITIAHRKAIDHHRARGRRPVPVAEVAEVAVEDPGPATGSGPRSAPCRRSSGRR